MSRFTDSKMKCRLALALTVAALVILLFQPLPEFLFYFTYGIYPVLGSLAAGLTLKVGGVWPHRFFEDCRLTLFRAAVALGGPTAGLLALVITLSRPDFAPPNPDDPICGEAVIFYVPFIGVALMSSGQIFWLLWPVTGLIFFSKWPGVTNVLMKLQDIIMFCGVLFLIPLANILISLFLYPLFILLWMLLAFYLFATTKIRPNLEAEPADSKPLSFQ